jgi:hypothetical protein
MIYDQIVREVHRARSVDCASVLSLAQPSRKTAEPSSTLARWRSVPSSLDHRPDGGRKSTVARLLATNGYSDAKTAFVTGILQAATV